MTRKVLLCVSGLTPQIVTETLYALACRGESSFIPDEVHLITTAEGAERARLQLLSDPPGWLHRLRAEYALPPIRFDDSTIHVLEGADGRSLIDIRTPDDNAAAADGIVETVRRLTSDPDTELHVSIAGGRKTMGFFVGYALSLYGRDQDRMSHVLVESPYESLRDFFYPSRRERIIFTRDDRPVDAASARIWLAEIPFVRMRAGVPESLKNGQARYSEVVRAASSMFDAPRLRLDVARCRIETPLGGFALSTTLFAFYWWLAERRSRGDVGVHCPPDGAPSREFAAEIFDKLDALTNHGLRGHGRTREGLKEGMSKQFFERSKTRINRAVREALKAQNSPYEIARIRRDGRFVFGLLSLSPDAITVVEP